MSITLDRLGARRFEELVQALAIAEFGFRVQVFGPGKDGGRDGTIVGKFRSEGRDVGAEYAVIQAKFRERSAESTPKEDLNWFKPLVQREISRWAPVDESDQLPTDDGLERMPGQHDRPPVAAPAYRDRPDFLIFATNARLSAALAGGIDQINDIIASQRYLSLKGWKLWHADEIERLIEVHEPIRNAFADLILPGDVLSRVAAHLGEENETVVRSVVAHMASRLESDQSVHLSEAGEMSASKLALAEVAVDLPCRLADGQSSLIIREILRKCSEVRLPFRGIRTSPSVAILGGPGRGKSTIVRLAAQELRASFFLEMNPGSYAAVELAHHIKELHQGSDLAVTTRSRYPFVVTLSDWADTIYDRADQGLLPYLTDLVNRRNNDVISQRELGRFIRRWPTVVFLDGLDEVPYGMREDVLTGLREFREYISASGSDCLLIVTSRPQDGFEQHLRAMSFEPIELEALGIPTAMRYAGRLLQARHATDVERFELVMSRLSKAASESVTRRLLSTPLQITIMSLILESRRRAPTNRYALFDDYYRVIYQREASKPGHGEFLETHRAHIDSIHEQVALAIHSSAEHDGDAETAMGHDELVRLIVESLETEGYSKSDATTIATAIVRVTYSRLVLIVPHNDGIGFELRSLQEYLAARALTRPGNANMVEQLLERVPSAHWRNTWLLAAGRLFAEHRARAEVLVVLSQADAIDSVTRLVRPGALLSLDILEDGAVSDSPMYQSQLIERVLGLIDVPIGWEFLRLGRALRRLYGRGIDTSAKQVVFSINRALRNGGVAAVTAISVLNIWLETDNYVAASYAKNELTSLLARGDHFGKLELPDDLLVPRVFGQELAQALEHIPNNGVSRELWSMLESIDPSIRFVAGIANLPTHRELANAAADFALGLPGSEWRIALRIREQVRGSDQPSTA